MPFEPKLVAFLCNWCSYTAADAAGQRKLLHPPNVRPIRVMCTGRVDPSFVLKALSSGADGVLVCGCHAGDCHYVDGNKKAMGRLHLLRSTVAALGIEPERVRLEWVSAQESERYVEVVTQMIEALRSLGPLDWPGSVERDRQARLEPEQS